MNSLNKENGGLVTMMSLASSKLTDSGDRKSPSPLRISIELPGI